MVVAMAVWTTPPMVDVMGDGGDGCDGHEYVMMIICKFVMMIM